MTFVRSAPIAELPVRSRIRLALFVAAQVLALVLTGPFATPARAQGSAMPSKRDEQPVDKKVKASGPARRTTSMRARHGKNMMSPSRVVIVFPTDAKGGVSDQLSDLITETIQSRIALSGRFQTVYFLRSIPTVARALNEGTLTANEVSHPYDDDAKLRKLMPNTGFDMALTTSIDSYTYDAAKNQVSMLISARLIDYRGEKPVVRAAAENGSSPENGGNARELTLAQGVAKSITEKLVTSLLAQGGTATGSSAAAPAK